MTYLEWSDDLDTGIAVIDGEVSRTSQLTRARSAIWSRTWMSPVLAVTAQSIRRTSSPGW